MLSIPNKGQGATKILCFTSLSDNHQEEVDCLKPRCACPYKLHYKLQQRNKTSIKCAQCSAPFLGLGTEINPNGPGCKTFHGCYTQKQSMASKH